VPARVTVTDCPVGITTAAGVANCCPLHQ
jgi:hypothetical protein